MNRDGRPVVGLALSGGAARGPAHVGVLRVLERNGIPIDVVAGVSAGSIMGALYCAGISPEVMVGALDEFRWLRITRLAWPPWHGILSFAKLEQFLIQWIGDVWFSDLKKPFAVGTTDLLTGRAVTFVTGRVAPLVRASCSIPGLVTPMEYGPYWLVDGGASANLPSQAARALGADVVIGVDLIKPHVRRNYGPLGLATTALEILVRQSGGGLTDADVLICPPLENMTYARFSRAQEMLRRGEEAAEAMLPAIRRAIAGEPMPSAPVELGLAEEVGAGADAGQTNPS